MWYPLRALLCTESTDDMSEMRQRASTNTFSWDSHGYTTRTVQVNVQAPTPHRHTHTDHEADKMNTSLTWVLELRGRDHRVSWLSPGLITDSANSCHGRQIAFVNGQMHFVNRQITLVNDKLQSQTRQTSPVHKCLATFANSQTTAVSIPKQNCTCKQVNYTSKRANTTCIKTNCICIPARHKLF